jgi:hypothetical protein
MKIPDGHPKVQVISESAGKSPTIAQGPPHLKERAHQMQTNEKESGSEQPSWIGVGTPPSELWLG